MRTIQSILLLLPFPSLLCFSFSYTLFLFHNKEAMGQNLKSLIPKICVMTLTVLLAFKVWICKLVEKCFTVSKTPTSPEEADDGNSKQDGKEEINPSWVFSLLPGYGELIGYLRTLSSTLSLFTECPPAHPLIMNVIPLPWDAKTFVKALQSMALKTTFLSLERLPTCWL